MCKPTLHGFTADVRLSNFELLIMVLMIVKSSGQRLPDETFSALQVLLFIRGLS